MSKTSPMITTPSPTIDGTARPGVSAGDGEMADLATRNEWRAFIRTLYRQSCGVTAQLKKMIDRWERESP